MCSETLRGGKDTSVVTYTNSSAVTDDDSSVLIASEQQQSLLTAQPCKFLPWKRKLASVSADLHGKG